MLDAGIADAVGGVLDGAVDVGLDPVLQLVDAEDALGLAGQQVRHQRPEQPAERPGQTGETEAHQRAEEGVIAQQALQDGRYFGVVIGSDGFELAHHALLLDVIGWGAGALLQWRLVAGQQ
ncbi:hypothetical protein D3C81_699240 [compost metagenome]